MRRVTLLILLFASACDEGDDLWTKPLSVVGPVPAAGQLVWLHRTAAILTVLDPTGGRSPAHHNVIELPRDMAPTSAGVVVVGGHGARPGLDLVSLPGGEVTRVAIPGAYDHVAVSPSGRFAVLFYDPSAPPAPGGPAARNNNEITVVDLQTLVVSRLSLATEALAPEEVLFSPDGEVAAILLDSAVALVVLADPATRVQVPLKLPGGRVLRPAEALFAPAGDFLYVRSADADDVLALEVARGEGGIHSSINFLFFPGARGLKDIAVPAGPGFEHAVAALYSDASATHAVLLDAAGDASRTHFAQLARPATALADLGEGRLLIYSDPRNAPAVQTKAVAGWEPLVDRFDEDQLQGPVQAPPQIGMGGAFLPHALVSSGFGTSAALTGITLQDDGTRLRVRLSPIVLGGPSTAAQMDGPTGTLFLSVTALRKDSGAAPILGSDDDFGGNIGALVAVKADSLAIGGVPLDHDVTALGRVGDHLYALHPGDLGDITFLPAGSLDRAAARRVVGFLAGGLLDRPEEDQP